MVSECHFFALTALSGRKTQVRYSFSPHIISYSNCRRKLYNCLIICTISSFTLSNCHLHCLSSCFRNIRGISGKRHCGLDSSSAAGLLFHSHPQVIFPVRQHEWQCPVHYYCAQTVQKALSTALPAPRGFSIGTVSKWLSMTKP